MNNGFEMPNGRKVSVNSFQLESTYAGVHEGTPEWASEAVLKKLQHLVEKQSRSDWPIVVVAAAAMPLPCYQLTIRLTSSHAARQTAPDYSSRLQIISFADSLDNSISKIVNSVLPEVDWEQSAADYDIMGF